MPVLLPAEPLPVFQDPPAFTVRPKEEYFQEVGRELVIPCAAHGDPPPTITWLKVGAAALRGGRCFFPPGPLLQGGTRVRVPARGSRLPWFLLEKGLRVL